MWKKYCRVGQVTDTNMAHTHCMLDTTDPHTEYVILNVFTLQEWLQVGASMLFLYVCTFPVLLFYKHGSL